GNAPELIADLRGPAAAAAIPKIEQAVAAYPYADSYRVWPGPNSNTFVAYLPRAAPEVAAALPPTAVGQAQLGPSLSPPSPSGPRRNAEERAGRRRIPVRRQLPGVGRAEFEHVRRLPAAGGPRGRGGPSADRDRQGLSRHFALCAEPERHRRAGEPARRAR